MNDFECNIGHAKDFKNENFQGFRKRYYSIYGLQTTKNFGKVFLIYDLLKLDKFYESYLDFARFWLKQEILHLECLYFIDGRNFPL